MVHPEIAGKISNAFGAGMVTLIVDHLTTMSQLTAFYRTLRVGAAYTIVAERMSQDTRRALKKAVSFSHRAVGPILGAWAKLALVLERPGRCEPGLLERRCGALLAECIRFATEHMSLGRGVVLASEAFVKMSEQLEVLPSMAFALARIGSTLTLATALIIRMLGVLLEYHRTTHAFPTPIAVCSTDMTFTLRSLEYPDASLLEASPTAISRTASTLSSSSAASLRASFTELITSQKNVAKLRDVDQGRCAQLVQVFLRQVALLLTDKLEACKRSGTKYEGRPIQYLFVTNYEDWKAKVPKRFMTTDGSSLEGFMAQLVGLRRKMR